MASALATYNLGMVLPKLRSDLVISRQAYRGRTSYVVKDPIALRYTRLGEQEIAFAGLLDGKRTFEVALAELRQRFPGGEMNEERVSQLLNLFARLSWVFLPAQTSEELYLKGLAHKKAMKTSGGAILSALMIPFFFKMTLLDPDRILIRLEKKIRFIWTKKALWLLGLLLTVAIGIVLNHLDKIAHRTEDFFTLHNLVSLWFTMIAVKVVHEFGHGLTCKHYGGEVHEMGGMFIVFTPFLFCDATDSWMFPSKWRKIAVNLAGIYFELWLAGLATFVWVFTQPGLINELALNVMFICSVSTIFFNINPLMRFDGYYVLADWLETPNLRDRARLYALQWYSHLLLGARHPGEDTGPRPGLVLFAVGSYLYTWVVLYRIVGAIGHQLEPYGLAGAGQTLEVFVFGVGVVLPLISFGRNIHQTMKQDDGHLRKRMLQVAGGAAAVLALLALCPWSMKVVSGCVIGDNSAEKVRARVPGFLREMFVREGSRIQANQVIATLENRDLQYRLADSQLRQEAVRLGGGAALASEDSSALQRVAMEQRQIDSLKTSLAQEAGFLKVTSERDGIVITPNTQQMRGLYYGEGDVLCEVMPLQQVTITIAIKQQDVAVVRAGQPVELRFYSFPDRRFRGQVVKVFNSASAELAHEALSARAGGEVPTEMDRGGAEHPMSPIYQAELAIDNSDGLLRMGMTGLAKVSCGRTMAGHAVILWFRRMLHLDFQV